MNNIILPNFVIPDLAMQDFNWIYPIFNLIKNGIALTDQNSKILYVNPFYSQITGYSAAEAIGKNPGILRSGYHDEKFYKKMWDDLNTKGFWEGDIWNRNKAGEIYPSLLTISKLQNQSNNILNYLAIFSDITFLKLKDAETINLAFYDFLTKLPNRLSLEEYFKKTIQKIQTNIKINQPKITILFFDLNKFKLVNDQHGHVVGDKLLKSVAERLQSLINGTNFIARFGGDEFVAVVSDLNSAADIKNYCNKIKELFSTDFNIDGLMINSSCSIGSSVFPDDAASFEALINKADRAMYLDKAKHI